VKLHYLSKVGQKVCDAVIPGVGVVFVFNVLIRELAIEGGGTFFEPVVIFLAAVEVNGDTAQRRGIALG
jgi:hypothetical protein